MTARNALTDFSAVAPVTIIGVSCTHESDRYGQRTWAGALGVCALRATQSEERWHLTLHGPGGLVMASGWSERYEDAHAELLTQARAMRDALAWVP